MSRKTRFISLILAIAILISSVPAVAVCAEADDMLSGITNPFTPETVIPLPDGSTTTSDSYRIPAMVTLADGTIVAAADVRWDTTYDGGGLDTLVARSTDGGKSWTYNLANYLSDNGNKYNYSSTTFIDPSLLVAADGQTVYMLVDLYAYGVALNGLWQTNTKPYFSYPEADTGFDENGNLKLSSDGRSTFGYYLKNGRIYANGTTAPLEGYSVDEYFNITYSVNGETLKSNLFCADSPFKVARTQYLYLTKSTDGGATWSSPTLLNLREPAGTTAKNTDEDALLVSPGNAITTSSGLMVYPVYSYAHYTSSTSVSNSYQHLGLIYSTDGVTWERTENFTGMNFSSEGSIVELENGNLRVFFRNETGYLCYVDYDLSTKTWQTHVQTEIPTNSNTQMSAITYSKTSNGKQVILISCPTGPNEKGSTSGDGSQRTNGKIHVFTVNADSTMKLENTINLFDKAATSALSGSNYLAEDGFFAYSSLTERSDGAVVLLYEDNQFGWGAGEGKYYTMDIVGYRSSALGITLDTPKTVIVDKNGNVINSIQLGLYEKNEIWANMLHNSSADIHYQWQLEDESGKWMDIYGENEKSIELSFGMVGTLLGSDGKVNIRCKTSDAIKTVYSNSIPVTITMYQPQEPDNEVSQSFITSTGETVKVSVAGAIPEDASVQLSETDSSGIEVGSNETVAMTLDISIKNADGSEWQPASGETVTVTLEASQIGLQNGDQVVVYHLHEGNVKVLGTFEVTNDTISFDVDGFSKFVFAVAEDDNYDEMLGMYAGFNALNEWTSEGYFDYFWVKSDPSSDSENNYEWSIYDEDFEIDQVVKIKDYLIDAERNLWFKVEPVNGLELPETLKARPWVHFNNLDNYDSEYDTLFFFEPEDLSQEDIAVVDKYGLSVWELYIYSDEKREITVQTNLSGEVKYRWEVCYDPENLLWTAIEGQTSSTLNLSFGMLSGVLQDGEWAALRCVAYNATESVASNAIVARVILTENLARNGQQQVIVVSTAPEAFAFGRVASHLMLAKSVAPLAEDDKVVVTLTAEKEDGTIILQEPYELEYNGTVSRKVEIPYIKGYDLCDADGNKLTLDGEKNVYTFTVNETNVTENLEIVLTYKPGKTTYKVTYYLQNVLDEQYTQYGDSVILEGITGEMVDVSNEAFSKTFDGFYQLLFETAEIASDGSTEIEVYYDRLYYKMLFDLDGGYGVQPVYARYGTPVSVDNPTKAGYIFVGWEPNKGWTEDFVTGEVTEWDLDHDNIGQFIDINIPAHHTSYTAIWRVNDSSKVTVVVWGQNADDDGYSYVSEETFEIYANTGSTITYVPGQNMCGFEAHTHSSSCSTTCGEAEHTHSIASGCYDRICGKEEHTVHTDACWNCGGFQGHDISCFRSSNGTTLSQAPETDAGRLATLRSMPGPNYPNNSPRLYRTGNNNNNYRYYYKLGDNFYRITGTVNQNTTVTLRNNNCHPNLHTAHNTSCAMTCDEHTHSDVCYELKCTTKVHTHSAGCYNCGKKAHTHDASCRHTTTYDNNKLWNLNEAKTGSVTVAADGSTVYNVYYDRTEFTLTFNDGRTKVYEIKERWGKNISSHWPINGTNGTVYGNGERWDPSGSSEFSEVLVFIELMPQESFSLSVSRVNYDEFRMHYMTEVLPGTVGATAYTFNNTTKYFVEAFDTVVANYNYVTKAEDFFDLKGFEQWTSNPKFGSNNQLDINGGGNVYFYYTRNKTQLVFNNYGANTRVEEVFYQAPLSVYESYELDDSLAPSVYQEGSVTFKGWYRSPQVPGNFNFENELPFDFATATMPEGDLILYAWWEPINHDVTFYHSYEDLEAGEVYTVEGITYDYDVPHGSIIQSPYTPPADPTNGKYDFLGWFYINENGIETLWDFKNTTVTSDVKIYAKWTSNTLMNYTVKFVYKDANGNEIEIADPITGSALAGNTKTFDAKVGSALKVGYQTRYFPEIQSHSLTIDIEDETKNVYTFYYVYRQTVPYSVYYLTKENPNTGLGTTTYNGETYYLIAKTKTVEQNEKAIVTENAVLISGYVFDEYQKRLYIDPNNTKNALYFIYEKDNVNGQYVVHYMTEKADGSGFDEHSSFTGKMSSGSVYSVPNPPKEIQHFTWAKGYNKGTNVEKMSGTVKVGEVLELWVYYTRNEYSYTVQYIDRATGLPVHTEKNGTAKWESQITENAVDVNGYELLGDKSYTLTISDNPVENVITFYYVKDVTIKYQVVGPTGCGSVDVSAETIGASTGKVNGSTPAVSSNVYKFVGWYLDADCKNPVPAGWVDGENKIKPQKPGELWVNVTYYAKFEYNLTSLTIDKVFPTGADYSMDLNQSFLFDIVEVDESGNVVSNGVNLTVTIHKDGSIKIDGLTVGHRYKITEKTDWSWRYGKCTPASNLAGSKVNGNSITVKLSADVAANKVTFTNERTYKYWLDGDYYKVNLFKKKAQ